MKRVGYTLAILFIVALLVTSFVFAKTAYSECRDDGNSFIYCVQVVS